MGIGVSNLMVMVLPLAFAVPSMLTRFRPSSTVTFVVEPSKLAPLGSFRVTDETPSFTFVVASQVRRVLMPPMTLSPPSSFGRAVALLTATEPASPESEDALAVEVLALFSP